MVIDYLVLGLYVLGMVAIAIYTKNRSKTVKDFLFAGSKGLNGWMTAFAYGTTYFSAVIFIGYAGNFGSQYGLAAVWIGIGNAIIGSLVAWIVLAKRTKVMSHNLESKTMPEFFEKRYGSKSLKLVTAIITFVFLIPYSASVYNGLSSLFEIVFNIEGWIIMICLAVITAIYLFFGGYFATALSDFIQGIIMIIGVVLMVIFFMSSEQVSWDLSGLVNNPEHNWFTFSSSNTGIYGNTMSLLSLIFLTSFGVWALPQTVHKYHTIRDDKSIKQGTIVSTIFALIIGFCAYFVGALSGLFPNETVGVKPDNVIPTLLNVAIPSGLMGIIAVLILSASMSTLASVSLSSASTVAVDIYKGKINTSADDKKVNWTMRIFCIIFIVISVVLAILNEEVGIAAIAHMMGISWGTLAGCFIGPFVLGLLWKKTTKAGAWASVVSSLVMTIALIIIIGYDRLGTTAAFGDVIIMGIKSSPMIGSICMIFSIVITFVVSLLTKAPDKEIVNLAFKKN